MVGTWSSQKATSLLAAITTLEFLMAFLVVNNVLGFTKALTLSLQSQAQDICNAYNEVDSDKRALQDVHSNIDTYNKKWYGHADHLREKVHAGPPTLPCTCSCQVGRANVIASNPEEYYRWVTTAPCLAEVNAHIDTRFSDLQKKAIQGMSIVPLVVIENMSAFNSYASLTKDLAELYADDLLSPFYLEHEVHLWHTKWNNCSDKIPAMPSEALLHANERNVFHS